MTFGEVCSHNQLKRSCYMCDLEDEIDRLESELKSAKELLQDYADSISCFDPDYDKKMTLEGDDILEIEIPCKECTYCKTIEWLSQHPERSDEKEKA